MGAIYVLVALGLYITHLTTHRVNFGQGDFLMVGTFLMLLIRKADAPLGVAIAGTLVVLAIMGWLLERIAIRPLDRKKTSPVGAFSWILTTAGIALILQNAIELGFGKTSQYSAPLFSSQRDQVVQVLGAGLFLEEILVILAAILIVAIFMPSCFTRVGVKTFKQSPSILSLPSYWAYTPIVSKQVYLSSLRYLLLSQEF